MANFPPQTLTKSDILKEPEFDLDKVKGHVKLTKAVTIGPLATVHTSGLTECNQHFKRVNVIVEPYPKKNDEAAIPVHGYTMLKPGSSKVSIGIQNLSCRQVTIPAKSILAKIATANVVSHSYAPNLEIEEQSQQELPNWQQQSETALIPPALISERERLLFDEVNLDGSKNWSEELKLKTKDLFRDYVNIFALERNVTYLYSQLDNYTPFKEVNIYL